MRRAQRVRGREASVAMPATAAAAATSATSVGSPRVALAWDASAAASSSARTAGSGPCRSRRWRALFRRTRAARRHAVLGERARLVGADDADGAERLDGGEALHDASLARHALHPERERQGQGGKQSLGHVGDDHTEREDEALGGETRGCDGEGEEATPNAAASRVTMRVTRAISRCSGLGGSSTVWVRRAMSPIALFMPVARTIATPPRHHRGPGEHQLRRSARRDVRALVPQRGQLEYRVGLPREGALIDAQAGSFEELRVGRDRSPVLELHDVAGHQARRPARRRAPSRPPRSRAAAGPGGPRSPARPGTPAGS